jgi:tetratricopeptide (TPR) repeat protein
MRRELLAAGPATDAVAARIAIHTSEVAVAHAGERARIDGRSQRQLGALLDSLLTVTAPDTISATAAMQPFLRREFVVTRAPGSGGEELYQVLNYRRSGGAEGEKNTRFVGRQSDMAALEERLALALTGRGQVVAIIGDPGLGKSRLLAEFARSRPARAARFLETGSAYAAITPHLPVIELLRRFFGIEPADDTDTVRQRVAATLTSRHAGLASSRSALLALVGAPDQDWSGLDPIERRHRIHEAVKRLLIAESRIQPLVIVFEDVHWIDSESQALLDALVQALPAAPVLLLLTYRPRHVQPGAETTPREDPRHQWSERSHYTQWSLSPLSSASTAELLEDLLGNDPSLEPLKRRLEEWTDGNPFFLEECVQALLQTGVLQGRRGSYRATDGSPALAVPATVEDILAARIDGLVEDDKRLVQSAAVVGTDVPLAMLSAIVDWPADALREGMERLQAAELMYESHAAPAETFVFKHALTREVAYRGLEASERRRLHQKIAAALAAAPSEMGPEHLDRLARHAVQGELWQDAANYLRQAGNRAMRSAAVTEAAKYFGEALAALRQLPPSLEVLNESIHVRISLQDAFWPPLQFDRQFEVLKEAEKLAEKGADLRWRGWIACYLCRYFWAVGDNAQARLAGDRALEIARSVGNLALIAETNVYRGLVQDSAGEYREAVETLTAALRDLERAISESRSDFPLTRFASSGPVIVRSFLVRALAELGDFATAVMAGEEAMRLADASGSPFALVAAAGGLGAVHVRQRRPQQAIDVLEPALRATRMYRLRHWLPTVGGSLGAAYVACGRIDEGLPLLRECVEHGERFRLHAHASMWAIHLGHAYLRAGRRDQALSLAQDIVARCRQRQEQGNEASALRLLADVEATGDSADQAAAASRYEHVLALAREFGMRPLEAHCHHALGTLLVGLGRREQGTTLLAMAAEAYRALDMPEAA